MIGRHCFLTPCSWLFAAGVGLRHFLYDQNIFTRHKAPLPVISIGNLVAGGAGKTQAALMLAEDLSKNLRVAVLSRGYKSLAEHAKQPLLVKPEKHKPHVCGDEAWLLASRLPSSLIYANKNRYKSALEAKKAGAQLIILDDGMQHRKVHRDLEVVIIDSQSPLDHFLPRGSLREQLRRLSCAHMLFFVGHPEQALREKIASFTSAPQVVTKIVLDGCFTLDGQQLSSLKNMPVALFCGIGNPSRFVRSIEELGAQVVAKQFSKDHQLLGENKLLKFAAFAREKGAKLLVCTEKDKVKLSPGFRLTDSLMPIAWVKAHLEIIENREAWITSVNAIKKYVS
jgi:tetraacyldisaccharide 4'-kinase